MEEDKSTGPPNEPINEDSINSTNGECSLESSVILYANVIAAFCFDRRQQAPAVHVRFFESLLIRKICISQCITILRI
jgi:hypothetical protein